MPLLVTYGLDVVESEPQPLLISRLSRREFEAKLLHLTRPSKIHKDFKRILSQYLLCIVRSRSSKLSSSIWTDAESLRDSEHLPTHVEHAFFPRYAEGSQNHDLHRITAQDASS